MADSDLPADDDGPEEPTGRDGDGRRRDDEMSLKPSGRFVAIVLGLVVLYVAVNFVDVWLGTRAKYEGSAPAAVVLGAAQYNGRPSAALQGRLDRAANLYLDDRVQLVVVTGGGQATDITTEAKTGYDYLRESASIPDEDLRLEVDGTSTYESLSAVSRFLANEEIEEVIIVTDPFHAKRSSLTAKEVGLEPRVSVTEAATSNERLAQETLAVAVGRLIGFRRIDAYLS